MKRKERKKETERRKKKERRKKAKQPRGSYRWHGLAVLAVFEMCHVHFVAALSDQAINEYFFCLKKKKMKCTYAIAAGAQGLKFGI